MHDFLSDLMQEYVSTSQPMLTNSLMQLVSTLIQKMSDGNPDDATQLAKVTLSKFIVSTNLIISRLQCITVRQKNCTVLF